MVRRCLRLPWPLVAQPPTRHLAINIWWGIVLLRRFLLDIFSYRFRERNNLELDQFFRARSSRQGPPLEDALPCLLGFTPYAPNATRRVWGILLLRRFL